MEESGTPLFKLRDPDPEKVLALIYHNVESIRQAIGRMEGVYIEALLLNHKESKDGDLAQAAVREWRQTGQITSMGAPKPGFFERLRWKATRTIRVRRLEKELSEARSRNSVIAAKLSQAESELYAAGIAYLEATGKPLPL